HHFPMRARSRIASLADEGTFVEEAAELRSEDPLHFFDLRPYTERLAEAEMKTGLGEAMVIGHGSIDGKSCELAVMDFSFMGGSMGSVVGEKFVRACDAAAERGVPLVSVTASGGARMQEGILSLMQLPKTVCAVADLHDSGGALISVMAHPTTAGVLASFASLGDAVVAEPGAPAVRPRCTTSGGCSKTSSSLTATGFGRTIRPLSPGWRGSRAGRSPWSAIRRLATSATGCAGTSAWRTRRATARRCA